jgi:steroid 5-alpha reductase family enzyme
MVLFAMGSWMNSYSEYARHLWKRRQENRGRLYSQGLFRYSRHPNYLGDLNSFSGICLISGACVTTIIPVLMLVRFVFVNIPVLDSHLHDHNGTAVDEYAAHTGKRIPFSYWGSNTSCARLTTSSVRRRTSFSNQFRVVRCTRSETDQVKIARLAI